MEQKKAIIIGAGPAGLTAAYLLLKETDILPVIYEESDAIGGISQTVQYKGNRMDLGGHRFFSKSPEVNRIWQELMPMQGSDAKDDKMLGREKKLLPGGPDPDSDDRVMLLRDRVSRILYNRKFFDYPISLKMSTLTNMGFSKTMSAGFGYLKSAMNKRKEVTLEDFMINRFGTPLYKMFFEDYTEKLWGRNPKDISADWGAQRIKGLSIKKAVAEMLKKPITIRTLDIGGDKNLPYYQFEKEENPFLGWRAIRFCLDMRDVFKTQLKAILRAAAFGDIRIMYPMIVSVEEFRKANAILEECKAELRERKLLFRESISTGIMVETPAAAFIAEELAKEADFFSIGTNDLTQYILAADRGNQKLTKLYSPFHPAVLRAVAKVIAAGHKEGKEVGMCGEFAADARAVPLLLGMGLDEFSMVSNEIAAVRYQVRGLAAKQTAELARRALAAGTEKEVRGLLER